jgi:glycosyltransferase involved in cell wall biosynthesis
MLRLPASRPAPREAGTRSGGRLRVAWLGHHPNGAGDGLTTYSREVTRGLAERGLDVVFFHHDRISESDGTVALDGWRVFDRLTVARSGSRRRLAEALREHQVDIVHVSLLFSNLALDVPRVCRDLGVPAVATLHAPFDVRTTWWGSLSRVLYRLYARPLSAYDRVVVFGERQRQLLVAMGVPAGGVAVIPNGVDVHRWSPGPSSVRERFGGERLFTFLGRLGAEKNVEKLLQAFRDVDPQGVRLLVVGGGKERNRLERRYGGAGITFLGDVRVAQEREAILRASDAFFLPSFIEGLSLALLEAMACGTAVAATDVGVHGDVLRGAGIVLDPMRLDDELRRGIRTLADSPQLCQTLGREARRRVVAGYSLESSIDRLVALYDSLAVVASGSAVATGA